MNLTQLTRDELFQLRERVKTTLQAREHAQAPTATQTAPDTSATSGGAELEALESNLKNELERYQKWMRKHQHR